MAECKFFCLLHVQVNFFVIVQYVLIMTLYLLDQ